MVLARLIETQIWHQPAFAGRVVGRTNKGTMASAITSIWKKAASPALDLKSNNSDPLRMSLVLFELLP